MSFRHDSTWPALRTRTRRRARGHRLLGITCLALAGLAFAAPAVAAPIDLKFSHIVTRGEAAPGPERTAARVLSEEVEKRTGLPWKIATKPSEAGISIVLISSSVPEGLAIPIPENVKTARAALKPEGFHISFNEKALWIAGADPTGVLFGVGWLLRHMDMKQGAVSIDPDLNISSSPRYPLRGHQLGFRDRANSWDAWDEHQFEQHIRELAFFGTNAIENIPFQDDATSPNMRVPRREMNRKMSEICQRYGLQYWVWTPADFDLNDAALRAKELDRHEELYKDCPRLDGVFFPGGDPGDNHPKLVMPFLEEIAVRLHKHHPNAGVWISLQGFDHEQVEYFYKYIDEKKPDWLMGVACGPSSPPIPETRRRLDPRYRLRHYPDITHAVRAQYPVAWWDPAFAFTLGRECTNAQPVYELAIHNAVAQYTDGFLTYSDGVHDDFNKIVWSAAGWNPDIQPREIAREYARVFFGADVEQGAADGILALETNWRGPLVTNGSVEATLDLWSIIEASAPRLKTNWRAQQFSLRAVYDAYTRRRLIFETALEEEANEVLGKARQIGADRAMEDALKILQRAGTNEPDKPLRKRIENLCDDLFKSISFQTSVPKYHASGTERGAVLDFVDHPLNNRWWLEDEFSKIKTIPSEAAKIERLDLIRTWEHPGPGSFYDDIGNVAKSPHVLRGEGFPTDPLLERTPNPDVMWWDAGRSRQRSSWITYMNWPLGMRYDGLDPKGNYTVRITGFRDTQVSVDGERVNPTLDGKGIGEFKEFPVPASALADGTLILTFSAPKEPGLNWRDQSRLTEVWVLKR